MWRVGELARAAGLTVRALHHYEDIGLLQPAGRSAAGHRRYGPEAVERLYRIGLLRQLGLSLQEIGLTLDDPAWDLRRSLTDHRRRLDRTLETATRLRDRIGRLLATLEQGGAAGDDLLTIVEDMTMLESPVRQRISILVYADLEAAYDELRDVFGLGPGELTRDPQGRAVHGELLAGDGLVWLHPETEQYGLASPRTVGAATATMAVFVDDVDEHHRRARAKGAEIVYGPLDQPYGYREYSARDSEGHLWSFMKPLTED